MAAALPLVTAMAIPLLRVVTTPPVPPTTATMGMAIGLSSKPMIQRGGLPVWRSGCTTKPPSRFPSRSTEAQWLARAFEPNRVSDSSDSVNAHTFSAWIGALSRTTWVRARTRPHEYPFLSDTIPPWGIRNRPDATYFPMPWVLSSRGFGLLIDRDELSYERFRTEAEEQWSVEVESDSLQYRYFAGPTSLDALRHFTAATGRQPEPSRWFFGPWYQSGHSNHVPLEKEKRQVELLRGSPASVVETHCRYLPRVRTVVTRKKSVPGPSSSTPKGSLS